MKVCTYCGKPFLPSREYHSICWECWRDKCDYREGGKWDYSTRSDTNWDSNVMTPASDTTLDIEILTAAVRLTHPDRHPPERKEQATQVTARLNNAIDRLRSLVGA